jgi:hypothetical protein
VDELQGPDLVVNQNECAVFRRELIRNYKLVLTLIGQGVCPFPFRRLPEFSSHHILFRLPVDLFHDCLVEFQEYMLRETSLVHSFAQYRIASTQYPGRLNGDERRRTLAYEKRITPNERLGSQ